MKFLVSSLLTFFILVSSCASEPERTPPGSIAIYYARHNLKAGATVKAGDLEERFVAEKDAPCDSIWSKEMMLGRKVRVDISRGTRLSQEHIGRKPLSADTRKDLDVSEKREDDPLKLWDMVAKVKYYYDRGKSQEGDRLLGKIISFKQKDQLEPAFNDLSQYLRKPGKEKQLERVYKAALDNARRSGSSKDLFSLTRHLDNLGQFYLIHKRYLEAEPFLVEALELYKTEVPYITGTISDSVDLIEVYLATSRIKKAKPLYDWLVTYDYKDKGLVFAGFAKKELEKAAQLYSDKKRKVESRRLRKKASQILSP